MIFIFFQISIRKILFIVLICLVVISPYVVRNILVFEKITITKYKHTVKLIPLRPSEKFKEL